MKYLEQLQRKIKMVEETSQGKKWESRQEARWELKVGYSQYRCGTMLQQDT